MKNKALFICNLIMYRATVAMQYKSETEEGTAWILSYVSLSPEARQ